ncbi:hypothetical protein H2O73_20150 [Vibrio sp. 404]|uniref:Uncharacterized protein n=1 Tax=Vibrio marinisediminis TaxID=2758441 RepID=A0A7W2IVR7_9VIBR|nr:hypothetical protein [Vibrio marinisediminis]MBA5764678.1 hypothetical protein [Vibrio marinisediminis]
MKVSEDGMSAGSESLGVEVELLQEKIRVLEIQNEILSSTSSDIQMMYFAALAFAATFLIAFLGVNIYFTRSKFEEERKLLENLFEAKGKELSVFTQAEIEEHLVNIKSELRQDFEQSIKSLEAGISRQKERLTEEVLEREYQHLKLEIACTDVEATKARLHIALCVAANKLDRDTQIANNLIQLNELLSKGAQINSLSVSRAIKDLRTLPGHHAKLVEQVENKIIQAHETAA